MPSILSRVGNIAAGAATRGFQGLQGQANKLPGTVIRSFQDVISSGQPQPTKQTPPPSMVQNAMDRGADIAVRKAKNFLPPQARLALLAYENRQKIFWFVLALVAVFAFFVFFLMGAVGEMLDNPLATFEVALRTTVGGEDLSKVIVEKFGSEDLAEKSCVQAAKRLGTAVDCAKITDPQEEGTESEVP